jgi:hypothetical protein
MLINILNETISDKRFIDMLNKMYYVNILCPEHFWIKESNSRIQGNVLSPLLCNIYLTKMDTFVKHEIINKMVKGLKPKINPEYLVKIGLTPTEGILPEHIKNKIKKTRRRHVEKLGIKRIIENEDFVRIKYIRYGTDFIIGVRGSLVLAQKIKELIKNFLKSTLHLNLNEKQTKITNTYSDKAKFLGMYIYNMNANDLPYRNSREVENTKRVLRKNKALKNNSIIKILKNTNDRIVTTLRDANKKDISIKGKLRNRISNMSVKNNIVKIQVLEEGVVHSCRPIIVIDHDTIYNKLKFANIINSKNNPACKLNIITVSDYNIITYFNSVARSLLSYFRCADDFSRIKSIVNWFIRYSAVATIKHKHKLASRKTVFDKYGINLTFTNPKGNTVSLVSQREVMALKKEYIINPDID